jgi:hypothetical protein
MFNPHRSKKEGDSMITSTHTIRRLVAPIALALAAAVLTVPSALASSGSPSASLTKSSSPLAGQCPCNSDLPLGASTRAATQAAEAAPYGAPSYCPCNKDLLRVSATRATRLMASSSVANIATPVAEAAPYGTPSYCPCNKDLLRVSATRTAPLTASSPVANISQPTSFHWGDFGIGIATAVGTLLMLAGLGIGMRQARQARHRLGSV